VGQVLCSGVSPLDEVSQGIAVEGGEEAVAHLRYSARASTDIYDNATIASDIEAFHRLKRPAGETDNFADIDLTRSRANSMPPSLPR